MLLPAAPTVSVILPSFNRPAMLREAIDSVLAQTFTDWELVVADDGSSIETRTYLGSIEDARIRIIWLPHSGSPAVARNAALAVARGYYVAFLDSDDTWMPTKLELQLAALRAKPACRWSYTATERLDARGQPVADAVPFVAYEGAILDRLLRIEAYIAMPTVLVVRELVTEVGGFDKRQAFGEDYDLWVRLAARSPVVAVDQRLARVRLHEGNYSHDRVGFYRGWLSFYDKVAATIADPATIAICGEKRAELALALANLHAGRRRPLDVARTIFEFRRYAPPDTGWWRGASRAFLRSFTPSPVLALYHRFRHVQPRDKERPMTHDR
jgi:glycosyltransferase involved in cell wall biosynthesis